MGTYYVDTFLIKSNENGIRYCDHKFKLGFTKDTNVSVAEGVDLPREIFKFRDFKDFVVGEPVDENLLFGNI